MSSSVSVSSNNKAGAPVAASTEKLLLNIGLKSSIGLAVSSLAALVAMRKPGGRLFLTGLGTGAGLGYAWCQNDVHLKNPSVVSLPESAQAEFKSFYNWGSSLVPSFAKFK